MVKVNITLQVVRGKLLSMLMEKHMGKESTIMQTAINMMESIKTIKDTEKAHLLKAMVGNIPLFGKMEIKLVRKFGSKNDTRNNH